MQCLAQPVQMLPVDSILEKHVQDLAAFFGAE